MLGYLVLTLGGLLFGAMVYRYDMHEREPWWMLVGAALVGALGMFIAFKLEDVSYALLVKSALNLDERFVMALSAGTIEEAAKLAAPVLVFFLARKHFNDPMDGLIYGSLAGLGAGLLESMWWQVFDRNADVFQQNGAALLRMFVHTIWGGISGYALGLIVMKKPWRRELLRSVGLVMLIHIVWDYFVGFVAEQNNWHRLVAALLLGGSICWYGLLVVKTNAWSRAMHAPTTKKRLVGKIVRFLITKRLR